LQGKQVIEPPQDKAGFCCKTATKEKSPKINGLNSQKSKYIKVQGKIHCMFVLRDAAIAAM
jgi:hypothetical protein